jgi:hypothetical protein
MTRTGVLIRGITNTPSRDIRSKVTRRRVVTILHSKAMGPRLGACIISRDLQTDITLDSRGGDLVLEKVSYTLSTYTIES